MPDDPGKRGPADRSRINVHEDYEVRYWCKALDCTKEDLEDCVKRVGPMADDVRGCIEFVAFALRELTERVP